MTTEQDRDLLLGVLRQHGGWVMQPDLVRWVDRPLTQVRADLRWLEGRGLVSRRVMGRGRVHRRIVQWRAVEDRHGQQALLLGAA